MDKYDITFLDWQVARCGTVAIDLSYFIFCCTDAEVRKRLPELMRIYHNQLIQRIDELGSNGQALFPFEKLEWHMKKYSKFGLGKFYHFFFIKNYLIKFYTQILKDFNFFFFLYSFIYVFFLIE